MKVNKNRQGPKAAPKVWLDPSPQRCSSKTKEVELNTPSLKCMKSHKTTDND